MLARYLASYTMPVLDKATGSGVDAQSVNVSGDTRGAQKLGQAAVARDIYRVYTPPGGPYQLIYEQAGKGQADAFYSLLRKGQLEEARTLYRRATGKQISIMAWDGGALHQRLRNSRGTINRGQQPTVVTDAKALKEYVRKIQARVGWGKSGWASAGKAVPGGEGIGQIPLWMQQPAPGSAGAYRDPVNPYIELRNEVHYVSDLMSQRTNALALQAFERSMAKEVQHVMAYEIGKLLS
jgi:hypothetical protein